MSFSATPALPRAPKRTCYTHPSQLVFLREQLFPRSVPFDPYDFSSLHDERRCAIDTINFWLFKSPKLVPHPLAATAVLADAILVDEAWVRQEQQQSRKRKRKLEHEDETGRNGIHEGLEISEWALKAVLSTAFCRFVNGLVDRDVKSASIAGILKMPTPALAKKTKAQGQGQIDESVSEDESATARSSTAKLGGESSMFANAALMGLPSSFVELRHACTHDETLPPLSVLRDNVKLALDWLWERWWRDECGNVDGSVGSGWARREREWKRREAEKAVQEYESYESEREADEAAGMEHANTAETNMDSSDETQDEHRKKRRRKGDDDVDEAWHPPPDLQKSVTPVRTALFYL